MKFAFLLALSLLLKVSLAQALNCNSFWQSYQKYGELDCVEFKPTSPAGNRFFYENTSWSSQDLLESRLTATAEALEKAKAFYASFTKVPPVYVVLVAKQPPGSGGLEIWGSAEPDIRKNGEPCPISLKPASLTAKDASFRQLIAHELFHCVQHENMPKAYTGVGVDPAQWEKTTEWWVEGTAEFFSSLVYPSANLEWSKTKLYDANQTLFEQVSGYSLAAYYQAMSGEYGTQPQQLFDHLKKLPSQGGLAEQRKAWSSIFYMRAGFHKFAQDFILNKIVDPGGGYMPMTYLGMFEDIEVKKKTDTYQMFFLPWVVKTFKLKLKPGAVYTVKSRAQQSQQTGAKFSIRPLNAPYWMDLNIADQRIDVSCFDDDQFYEVLVTRTDADTGAVNEPLDIEVEDKPCECEKKKHPIAECFVGSWVLDNSIFSQIFDGNPVKYEGSKGQLVIEFKETGAALFTFSPLEISTSFELEHNEVKDRVLTQLWFLGLYQGHVGVNMKTGRVCLKPEVDNTYMITTVFLGGKGGGGVVTTSPSPFMSGNASATEVNMSCNKNQIRYEVKSSSGDGTEIIYQGILNRM